ncbi:histidine kinase [Crocinitomicaceae bacterium]|nr:histidine kinase [Crocinitomicaceae bacterium]
MRILPLLFLFLTFSFASFSQKYAFVSYSTEEGLPQSQVNAIAQDDKGYLWIGTIGGLTRFNGEDLVPYTSREGLLNNRITSLVYMDNTLWVGHDGGISSIEGNTIKKYSFTGEDKSRPVEQILKFKDHLVICSNSGGLFELKDNRLTKIDLDLLSSGNAVRLVSRRVRSGYVSEGKLYLAMKEGLVVTSDLKKFEVLSEFGDHSFSGVSGDENEVIATTFDSLLIRKNLRTGNITTMNPIGLTSIRGCYIASDKTIWLHGTKGVVSVHTDGSQYAYNQKNGLPVNRIQCVYEDMNGNVWIGSEGKGIFRFPGMRFQYYDQSSGFLSDLITCGFETLNGDLYYGTFDKGILYKPKGKPMEQVEVDGASITVWAAEKDVDGKNWFGTQNSLVSVDGAGNTQVFYKGDYPGLPGTKIVSFVRLDENSMYIGGNDGVSLYRNGTFRKVGSRDNEYLGTVRDMEMVNGRLYCVSNLGAFEFRKGDFYPIKASMGRVYYSVVADDKGTIWMGSESGLYSLKNGEVSQLRLLQDDPRANIVNFLKYQDEKLYVGTNNGLIIISEARDGYKVKRYGPGDGIPDVETNLNSGFFDESGTFCFGTSNGLVKFHEDFSGVGAKKPLIHLKSILLNYAPFEYSLYSEKILPNGIPEKMVFPFNKNNLVFDFDGIALVNHKELKYQFKLVGLNNEWSPMSSVASITYTNLPAGEYKLMVRAVDLEGRQSESVSIPFVIEEAFYKTWWFILLCILAVAGVVLLTFRLRLRRIQQVNENEMFAYKARLLALEQKSLNASMNRHFIFNSLNSIQYFINTRDRLSANKYLTNFAKLIRKNLDSASVEDNMITLEEELSRIELYLSLESMRFKDRFEFEITSEGIDLELYKIPSMILQPFIENSIIHGILPQEDKKGLIEINIEEKGGILEISIKDNGIGINQSISRKVYDTGDHRSQGMEITSKRIELMQKFSDDAMELIGPEELIGDDGSINGTYVLLKLRSDNLED